MSELNEKLSAFVDGELRETDQLLRKLASDHEASQQWQRYHLIRDAMQGKLSRQPECDISTQLREAIAGEPVIFTPLWRRIHPRFIMKQAAGFAVAAAVGTLAVLSVQQVQLNNAPATTVAVAQPTVSERQQIRQVTVKKFNRLDAAVESKLNGYLVNHNEYSASARMNGLMPYTRIVSIVPARSLEKRAVNEK